LETVALKCLEKQPGRRYPTAAALAEDLRRYLDGRSVLARPPTPGDRLGKFLRRHRGPAVAAVIVLVTLVGGIIATAWKAAQGPRARVLAGGNESRAREAQQPAETNERQATAARTLAE